MPKENKIEKAPTTAWEQIYEMDDRDDMEWIEEMRKKHIPEISQVSTPNTIWVNGSFDVLHAGHIELFKYARSVGDRLVVGTDTDERIRELKGNTRPINKQKHRLTMLNAIKYIDQVVTFGSLEEQITRMKESGAKTLVIGSDYKGKSVVGEDFMEVVFFERVDDLSTTNIVHR